MMAEFAWRAIDAQGREVSGRIAAGDEQTARDRLIARKLYPVDVSPGGARGEGKSPTGLGTPRLNTTALALFTRQFATLVQVCPVEEALSTISRQSERAATRKVIETVRAGVAEGQKLADAMAREPKSFDPLYRAIVSAGDNAGRLPQALERMATLIERQAAIRAQVQTALAYPAVLAIVSVLVVAALMIFVVPRMVAQFETTGAELPMLTQIVMALSGFITRWWWAMAVLIAAALAGGWLALQDEGRRLSFDRWRLGWPLVGRMTRNLHAAGFARTLATMVAARLPLIEGLALARDTVSNHAQRHALTAVIERVRAGGSLSSAMQASGLFPPILVYLTASGESAGALDAMLERAAEALEREFDSTTSVALALLEPAVIVLMGIVVALIILSVLLPILQMESLAAL